MFAPTPKVIITYTRLCSTLTAKVSVKDLQVAKDYVSGIFHNNVDSAVYVGSDGETVTIF